MSWVLTLFDKICTYLHYLHHIYMSFWTGKSWTNTSPQLHNYNPQDKVLCYVSGSRRTKAWSVSIGSVQSLKSCRKPAFLSSMAGSLAYLLRSLGLSYYQYTQYYVTWWDIGFNQPWLLFLKTFQYRINIFKSLVDFVSYFGTWN